MCAYAALAKRRGTRMTEEEAVAAAAEAVRAARRADILLLLCLALRVRGVGERAARSRGVRARWQVEGLHGEKVDASEGRLVFGRVVCDEEKED